MVDEPAAEHVLPRLPYQCGWVAHDPKTSTFIIRLWDGRQAAFKEEWRAIKWAKSESEA